MDHGPYGSGWGREGIRHVVLNSITPGFILAPSFKIVFVNFAWVLLEKPKLTVNMITLLMLMHALWTFCYTVYKYPYSTIIEILYY